MIKDFPDLPRMIRFIISRQVHPWTRLIPTIHFAFRGIQPDLNGMTNLRTASCGLAYALFILMTFVVK